MSNVNLYNLGQHVVHQNCFDDNDTKSMAFMACFYLAREMNNIAFNNIPISISRIVTVYCLASGCLYQESASENYPDYVEEKEKEKDVIIISDCFNLLSCFCSSRDNYDSCKNIISFAKAAKKLEIIFKKYDADFNKMIEISTGYCEADS